MIDTPVAKGIMLFLLLSIKLLIRLFPLIPNNSANPIMLLDFVIENLENTKNIWIL